MEGKCGDIQHDDSCNTVEKRGCSGKVAVINFLIRKKRGEAAVYGKEDQQSEDGGDDREGQ